MVTINKQLISLEILAVIVGMFGPATDPLQHRLIYLSIYFIHLILTSPNAAWILRKNHLVDNKNCSIYLIIWFYSIDHMYIKYSWNCPSNKYKITNIMKFSLYLWVTLPRPKILEKFWLSINISFISDHLIPPIKNFTIKGEKFVED